MALIKCSECGKDVSEKSEKCIHCGNPISSVKTTEEVIRCPKCKSSQLYSSKKGFSGKKAVVGGLLTGGIGILAGTIGSNKIIYTCISCGKKFKYSEAITNKPLPAPTPPPPTYTPTENDKSCLTVVMVIAFIFMVILVVTCS